MGSEAFFVHGSKEYSMCLKHRSCNLHAQLCRISKAAKKKRHTGKFPRRFFFAQIILFTQSLANLRICQLLLPLQQQQLQQQSYQPLGCFLRRSDLSSLFQRFRIWRISHFCPVSFFTCHMFTVPPCTYNDFPDNSRSNIQKPRRPSEMSAVSG